MKKMILASTSTIYNSGYLDYLLPILKNHFKDVKQLLFIPYARASGKTYTAYTAIVKTAFASIGIAVKGIHEFENPKNAILEAEAIFTGGGNTFELVNQLYKKDVLSTLKQALENGIPYLGTSAGSNICGVTMMNTNDMPIVYPPSFNTLNVIPFNINAHYLDPLLGSTHMGESRETRIKEYHVFNSIPVLGLREGSWLTVDNDKIILNGKHTARLFKQDKLPVELESGVAVDI